MRHGLALAFLAASVAACTGNSGTTGTTGTTGSDSPRVSGDRPPITVTGCVQRGTPAGTYVLRTTPEDERAAREQRPDEGERPMGTGGSSPGGRDVAVTAPGGTYRLIPGNQENDLGRYEGRQVQVTGEIANPDMAAQNVAGQFLRVRSVETVAGSCQ